MTRKESKNGGYVNCEPGGTRRAAGTESRPTEEECYAEAEQKRQTGYQLGCVEGRIESLILGSVRLRGYDFGAVILAAHPSPGPRLDRLVRSFGHCSVLRYSRSSAGAGFQAWRP